MAFSILGALSLVFTGCSSKTDEQDHAKQIAAMTERISDLQQQVLILTRKLARARDTINELNSHGGPALSIQHDASEPASDTQRNGTFGKALAEMLATRIKKHRDTGTGDAGPEQAFEDLTERTRELERELEHLRQLLGIKQQSDAIDAVLALSDQLEAQRQGQLEAIVAILDMKGSPKRKIELLSALSELAAERDPALIDVVRKALADPDPEVGRHAIGLLDGYKTDEILPLVNQALQSRDGQTRRTALLPLAGLNDPQVADLLVNALSDTSEDVRSAALEVAQEHTDDIQLRVLERGLASEHEDLKSEALSLLEDRSDHAAVEIILTGLLDASPEFREKVNSVLYFLIDQEFDDFDTACAWWNEHKHRYDENLFDK